MGKFCGTCTHLLSLVIQERGKRGDARWGSQLSTLPGEATEGPKGGSAFMCMPEGAVQLLWRGCRGTQGRAGLLCMLE